MQVSLPRVLQLPSISMSPCVFLDRLRDYTSSGTIRLGRQLVLLLTADKCAMGVFAEGELEAQRVINLMAAGPKRSSSWKRSLTRHRTRNGTVYMKPHQMRDFHA